MDKQVVVKFYGIDSFNRPIFVDKYGNYYGCVDLLFPYGTTEDQLKREIAPEDITYFGNEFDCEPMGDTVRGLSIEWR